MPHPAAHHAQQHRASLWTHHPSGGCPVTMWPLSGCEIVCGVYRRAHTTHHAPHIILNPILIRMPHIPMGWLLTKWLAIQCIATSPLGKTGLRARWLFPYFLIIVTNYFQVYLDACLLVFGYPRTLQYVARLLMFGCRSVVRTPCPRIREHWPGKCFALLLSYMHGYLHHSNVHHLMHPYYMHRYISMRKLVALVKVYRQIMQYWSRWIYSEQFQRWILCTTMVRFIIRRELISKNQEICSREILWSRTKK